MLNNLFRASGRKILVVSVTIVALLLATVTAFAWFLSTGTIANLFDFGKNKVIIAESFDPDGENGMKEVSFTNVGDTVVFVRASATLVLVKEQPDGNPPIALDPMQVVSARYFTQPDGKWIDGKDGWYYYNTVLKPGESTDLMYSVEINANPDMVAEKKELYNGAQLDIPVNLEYLQVSQPDVIEKSWNIEKWHPFYRILSNLKTYPYTTATFIQPWLCNNWTDAQWETHLQNLTEVGIDTLIIQNIAVTPDAKISDCHYPTNISNTNTKNKSMLERCLKAAEKNKIKVFVGLNFDEQWWEKWDAGLTDTAWSTSQANLGNDIAKEIYDLYKTKYPNALHGWYFSWELSNGMHGAETQVANFLNINLTGLTAIDPKMPMMLSPFINAGSATSDKTQAEWEYVFAQADFRDGDIFCCQDSIGTGYMSIDKLDEYFSKLKTAINTEQGLKFWANNENFETTATPNTFQSAQVSRFVKQLYLAEPYVEGFASFSFSHYYSPDLPNPDGERNKPFYDKYKVYFQNGIVN